MNNQNMQSTARYYWVWRWHFYMGLFVAPFLIILAVTGLGMMFFAHTDGKDGERISVAVRSQMAPLSVQAKAAMDVVGDDAQIIQYLSPRQADMAAVFRVNDADGQAVMVAIDPYTAGVVQTYPRQQGMYHLMDDIHSELLMGKVGDYLLETAAALTILLIMTGVYLWWGHGGRVVQKLYPIRLSGRANLRQWHGLIGTYTAVMLLIFCISGMAWAGIWGDKLMQSWSQFPAGKWGVAPVPTSIVPVHGDLNDGKIKDIPWTLEKTPMPTSQPHHHTDEMTDKMAVSLTDFEKVAQLAKTSGLNGRYQIYFPNGETGVWTINQDSMSYDSPNPTADRTIHIDRYSRQVLADIRFDDYNAFGKFMAVSIAFHMGVMGLWSLLLNVVFCVAVIGLCMLGLVLWFKRRPNGAGLHPPLAAKRLPTWRVMVLMMGVVALIFPTALVALAVIALIDWLWINWQKS